MRVPNLDEDVFDELPPLEPDEIESSAIDLEGLDFDDEASLDDSVLGDEAAAMDFDEGPASMGEGDAEPMAGDFAGDMLLFDELSARDDSPAGITEDADLSFLEVSAIDDSGEEGPTFDADAIEEHSLPPIDAGEEEESERPRGEPLADGPAQGGWAVVGPRIALSGCHEVVPIARGAVVATQTGLFRVDLEGGRELLLGSGMVSVAAVEDVMACVDDSGAVHVRTGSGPWITSHAAGACEVRIVAGEGLVLTEDGRIEALNAESNVHDAANSQPLRQSWPSSVVAWSVSAWDVLFVHATRADRVRFARRSTRGEDTLAEFEARPELLTALSEANGEVAFIIDGRMRIAGHGDVVLPGRVIALCAVADSAWLVACEDRVRSGLLLFRVAPTGERSRLTAISGVGSDLEANAVHIAAASESLFWVAGAFGIVAVSTRSDAQSVS